MKKDERLRNFVFEREKKGDWANFISLDKLRLRRREIYEGCGFARSTLYQNKLIVEQLAALEEKLRKRGLLLAKEASLVAVGSKQLEDLEMELQIEALDHRLKAAQLKMLELSRHIEQFRFNLVNRPDNKT